MAKWSELHNGKFPDPYAKLKFEDEGKKKEKKLKKKKRRERAAAAVAAAVVAAQIDANGNKVRTFTGSLNLALRDLSVHPSSCSSALQTPLSNAHYVVTTLTGSFRCNKQL